MNLKSGTIILDSLVIIFNLSLSNTILPFLFISNSYGINSIIVLFLTLISIVIRFKKIAFPSHLLYFLYVLINLFCIISGLLTQTLGLGFIPLLFANFVFYIYLYNVYIYYKSNLLFCDLLKIIFLGYNVLCIYAIVSTIILWLMITFLNVSPFDNLVSDNYVLFYDNVERNSHVNYYFPYKIAIIHIHDYMLRLPFIQKFGVICGIFHEPNVMMHFVTPFFFIIMSRIYNLRWKFMYVLIALFIVLQSSSVTNFVVLVFVVFLYLIFKYKKFTLLMLCLLFIFGSYIIAMDSEIINLILYKANNEDGSQGFTLSTLLYAVNPQTVLGSSFYDISYAKDGQVDGDIGFIMFFINIAFILTFIYKLWNLLNTNNEELKWLGFAILYYIVHSIKLSMRTYSLSTLVFFMFILTICEMWNKKNRVKS